MKRYWQDEGTWLVIRWAIRLRMSSRAFFLPDLRYHDGGYFPFFASAVLPATCFGVSKHLGKIRPYLGLFFLLLPTSFIGGNVLDCYGGEGEAPALPRIYSYFPASIPHAALMSRPEERRRVALMPAAFK